MTNDNSQPIYLTGAESVYAPGLALRDATVLNFWQWAFSDLRFNDIRGVFAEWLVAKLLGIVPLPRDSWAGYDLKTPPGVTIEVKCSAYVQAWQQKKPSAILFTGLKGQLLDETTNQYASTKTYNADLYVFCHHIHPGRDNWNALDLDQWRFYILPRAVLAVRNLESIGLRPLQQLTGTQGWSAVEFQQQTRTIIDTLEARLSKDS